MAEQSRTITWKCQYELIIIHELDDVITSPSFPLIPI